MKRESNQSPSGYEVTTDAPITTEVVVATTQKSTTDTADATTDSLFTTNLYNEATTKAFQDTTYPDIIPTSCADIFGRGVKHDCF